MLELADLIGRFRPRTLFINTAPGELGPDPLLQLGPVAGLAQAVRGEATVRDVARSPADRSFLYIPAGQPVSAIEALAQQPGFRYLVRAAPRRGTLLLHATEEDLGSLIGLPEGRSVLRDFDGYMILGDRSTFAPPLSGVPLLARVERPTPGGGERTESGEMHGFALPPVEPERWTESLGRSRYRRRGKILTRPGVRVAGRVAGVWVTAMVGFWLGWQSLSDGPLSRTEEDVPVPSGEPPGDGPGEAPGALAGAPAVAAGTEPASDPRIITVTGLALPYSVLVGSYLTWEDAARHRTRLADGGRLALISPTPIRGRLYYRVFAGAVEDRVRASTAMRQLVETGDKEEEEAWHMRPVRLAFVIGTYGTVDEATERVERLHESGIPAYVLAVIGPAGANYRVYSGAFESEAAAGPLDSILAAAGIPATLETRRGEPR